MVKVMVGVGGISPQKRFRKKKFFLSLIKMLTQVLPAATDSATAPRASPTPCLWTHLVQTCPAAGAHVQTDPGGGQGDRWLFTSLPGLARPQLPDQHLVTTVPPHFQPEPHLSLTLSQGNGGVVPLISHLPSSCSAYCRSLSPCDTHTHTHKL